ncbi:MAG: hypothetical protein ACYDAQ_18720 [Mycobacteriales bacterium]
MSDGAAVTTQDVYEGVGARAPDGRPRHVRPAGRPGIVGRSVRLAG